MEFFEFGSSALKLKFVIREDRKVSLYRVENVGSQVLDSLAEEFKLGLNNAWNKGDYFHPLVELHVSGDNTLEHHSKKHFNYQAGHELRYVSHIESINERGLPSLVVKLASSRFKVQCHYDFVTEHTLRSFTEVQNVSETVQVLEYISSLALWNIDNCALSNYSQVLKYHVPYNVWAGECQWKQLSLDKLGLYSSYEYPLKRSPAALSEEFKQISFNHYSFGRVLLSSTGGMSSSNVAPVGIIENTEAKNSLFYQIEHNGSWASEVGDWYCHAYLNISGPNFTEHQWAQSLEPNECFTSVVVSFGKVAGSAQDALAEMTRYRRAIMRKAEDNRKLNVIFNDYMNCLMGDPTEFNSPALIAKAQEAGCEIYCIDAGWYADGFWWDGVGEWLPSTKRFPSGIKTTLDLIRKHGMIPGLWLEIEVMGIKCPLAKEWEDECFLVRNGKRVVSQSRYILNFAHPKVRAHADSVIKRLVEDYGVGYIKMDYNTDSGAGSDHDENGKPCSSGVSLLKHNRAYLEWLDSVFTRYPDLIIENCGSGGMRMDYAMLARHSIQSITDQTDYSVMGAIAAASSSLVTPEQAAIWAYPVKIGTEEEVIYNMVNAMLLRIHQSGHLAELSPERFALVKEGIEVYKSLRSSITTAIPVWPWGMPNISDEQLCFGLETEDKLYLAIWRQQAAANTFYVPLKNKYRSVQVLYPQSALERGTRVMLSDDGQQVVIRLEENYTARLLVLEK